MDLAISTQGSLRYFNKPSTAAIFLLITANSFPALIFRDWRFGVSGGSDDPIPQKFQDGSACVPTVFR